MLVISPNFTLQLSQMSFSEDQMLRRAALSLMHDRW